MCDRCFLVSSLVIILVNPSSQCSEIDLARCRCDIDTDDTENGSYSEETLYEVGKTFANDTTIIQLCVDQALSS